MTIAIELIREASRQSYKFNDLPEKKTAGSMISLRNKHLYSEHEKKERTIFCLKKRYHQCLMSLRQLHAMDTPARFIRITFYASIFGINPEVN